MATEQQRTYTVKVNSASCITETVTMTLPKFPEDNYANNLQLQL